MHDFLLPLPFLLGALPGILSGCLSAQDPTQTARLTSLQQQGLAAAIAIYPIHLGGGANRDVGDALGLLLEKRGLANLQPSETTFTPTDTGDWPATVVAFGEHVRTEPQLDYALYAAIDGTPKTGPQAVRYAIVDAHGALVVQEALTAADPAFAKALGKHGEPMTCCVFLRDRLDAQLRWPAAAASRAPGRFERLWQDKSGSPEPAERDAMRRRCDTLRAHLAGATIAVLPSRVGGDCDADSADRLATFLTTEFGARATAGRAGVRIDVAVTSNEQKRLWDFARALRAHLRQRAEDADYVLMADYAIDADKGERGCVHLVLCDRKGDWVAVDFQNSHHPDYLAVAPKSAADSDKVVTERLKQILR